MVEVIQLEVEVEAEDGEDVVVDGQLEVEESSCRFGCGEARMPVLKVRRARIASGDFMVIFGQDFVLGECQWTEYCCFGKYIYGEKTPLYLYIPILIRATLRRVQDYVRATVTCKICK